MAGAGFRTFVDGDVLTAAQVNTFLMEQSVMVFANAAARTSALPTPTEGIVTYLADTNALEKYTGATFVNITADSIPNALVDAKGDIVTATADNTPARLAVGTNERRLVADSAQATGLAYVADTTNFAVAAKGDLLAGTAADTVAALAVGTNNHVLTADSGEATGMKWAPVAAGGSLTFDSNTVATSQTTSSSGFTDLTTAGPAVTVTTGTKALVFLGANLINNTVGNVSSMGFAVSGASTVAATDAKALLYRPSGTNGQQTQQAGIAIVVTGLTAGANTFTAKYRAANGTATFINRQITVIDLGS